ncbi:MAG: hypothetical protein ACP5HD_01085 [Thermoproteus sp.]
MGHIKAGNPTIKSVWDDVRRAVEAIEEQSEYERSVKAFALKVLDSCRRSGDRLTLACCLKLLIEIGIQMRYMRRFPPEARLDVLKRRGRRGVSFNMSMLERSGLPGPYKRRVLRTYLKVSSYVHPSPEAMTGDMPDDLVTEVFEVLSLLYSFRG